METLRTLEDPCHNQLSPASLRLIALFDETSAHLGFTVSTATVSTPQSDDIPHRNIERTSNYLKRNGSGLRLTKIL